MQFYIVQYAIFGRWVDGGGREVGLNDRKLEKDWILNWRVLALNDKIEISYYNIHTF